MTLCPAAPDQVQAIHIRQAEIDDESIVDFLARERQCRTGVHRDVDLIAGFAQAAMKELSNCHIIFYYQ